MLSRVCPNCNRQHSEGFNLMGTVSGQRNRIVCYECRETYVFASDVRENRLRADCMTDSNTYMWYTREYWGAHYVTCGVCSGSIEIGCEMRAESRFNDPRIYCRGCYGETYRECEECSELQLRRRLRRVHNAHSDEIVVCQACFDESYQACNRCGNAHAAENINAEGYCNACVELDRRENSGVRSYSYRPAPKYFFQSSQGKDWIESARYNDGLVRRNAHGIRMIDDIGRPIIHRDTVYRFGFELEVEASSEAKRRAIVKGLSERAIESKKHMTAASEFYCKQDGSLGAHGFEIVSHPMTLPYWNLIREEMRAEYEHMIELGCLSYNTGTCGLHVHMSKASFTQLAIYKLQKLIYENAPFILKLSGRNKTELERWSSVTNANYINRKYASKAKGNDQDFERYVAVNLRNTHTIELRFFKGTLNFNTIERNLQFCNAAWRYCMSAGIRDIAVHHFKGFVLSKECKDLFALRHYFGERKQTKRLLVDVPVYAAKDEVTEKYVETEEHIESIAPLVIDSNIRTGGTPGFEDCSPCGDTYSVYYAGSLQHVEVELNNDEHIYNRNTRRYEFRDVRIQPSTPAQIPASEARLCFTDAMINRFNPGDHTVINRSIYANGDRLPNTAWGSFGYRVPVTPETQAIWDRVNSVASITAEAEYVTENEPF